MTNVPRRLVYSKTAQLLYTNTTATKLFTLPDGAIPLRVTVFTEATSTGATCTVGTAATAAKYISGLNVATAQENKGTLLNRDTLTIPTDIYGSIGGSPSSGGPFDVIMEYTSIKTTRVV